MRRPRVLASLLLVLAMLLLQFGAVLAAPAMKTTGPITGTVESITVDTTTNPTTVLVTVKDSTGATQTVRLSVDEAVRLGLVTLDPTTGQPVANQNAVG